MDTIVIKIGGVASKQLNTYFFQKISEWQAANKKIIIVHGGGYCITEMMEKLGVPVVIRQGLRVTTEKALAITRMVLIGQIQPMLTTLFQQHGFSAIGLHASCDQLIQGEFIDAKQLGAVGKITKINRTLLRQMSAKQQIPILAPMALTSNGEWLNVNGDAAASKIASELSAEALYLLTDVSGVKKNGDHLEKLTITELEELKKAGTICGGMLPKVNSAAEALNNGVGKVCITSDLQKTGTILTKEEVCV